MKIITSSFRIFIVLILVGCGMFEDNYDHELSPLRLSFRYPGIIEGTLVSQSNDQDKSSEPFAKNFIIVRNLSTKQIPEAQIVINVFSGAANTLENLVRIEVKTISEPLEIGAVDTLELIPSNDFFKNSNVEIIVTHVTGIDFIPMNGIYQGSYRTYKADSLVNSGLVKSSVDVNGSFELLLEGNTSFNNIDGTVTSDSIAFCLLRQDLQARSETITKFISEGQDGIRIEFYDIPNFTDSTVVRLIAVN